MPAVDWSPRRPSGCSAQPATPAPTRHTKRITRNRFMRTSQCVFGLPRRLRAVNRSCPQMPSVEEPLRSTVRAVSGDEDDAPRQLTEPDLRRIRGHATSLVAALRSAPILPVPSPHDPMPSVVGACRVPSARADLRPLTRGRGAWSEPPASHWLEYCSRRRRRAPPCAHSALGGVHRDHWWRS